MNECPADRPREPLRRKVDASEWRPCGPEHNTRPRLPLAGVKGNRFDSERSSQGTTGPKQAGLWPVVI